MTRTWIGLAVLVAACANDEPATIPDPSDLSVPAIDVGDLGACSVLRSLSWTSEITENGLVVTGQILMPTPGWAVTPVIRMDRKNGEGAELLLRVVRPKGVAAQVTAKHTIRAQFALAKGSPARLAVRCQSPS